MADNPWSELQPGDGFFAKLEQLGDVKAKLVFGVTARGQKSQSVTLETIEWPTAQQVGALKRKLIILEAMAEFLNAGGRWSELDSLPMIECWLLFDFKGWNYFDGGINTNGNRVHEFISDDATKFVRWVRNEYIDTDLTLEQIKDDSGTPSDSARGPQDNIDAA